MHITIPAGQAVQCPSAFFAWLAANGVIVEQVSNEHPFHVSDGELSGVTVFGTEFTVPVTVPMTEYLASWLLEHFPETETGTSVLDDMESMIDGLGKARQAAKDATEKANELRDQILARLRIEGAAIGTVGGRPAVERKVIESKRLDTAKLRREQPDIADIYTSVSTSERLEIL
jgi:hypothetical protein